MKFKKGDFLHIHTDGEYRCITADDQIAVFAAWRYGTIHPEFLRVRCQNGKQAWITFDDSDMIEIHEDVAL